MKKLFLNLSVLLTVSAHTQSVGIGTSNPTGIFHVTNNPSGSNALFYVSTNGNVGVGTINPQSKLEVSGQLNADSIRIITGFGSKYPFIVQGISSAIDQSNMDTDISMATSGAGWQSFTAGRTGRLDSVNLLFSSMNSFPRTLKIYEGEGVSGAVLATANLPALIITGMARDLNVPVIAGNKYTIWLDDAIFWLFGPINPYSGGISETNFIFPSKDRVFKTYVSYIGNSFTIDNAGKTTITSLQLPAGAGAGKILTSDNAGNVGWQPEKWITSGGDIFRSTGNVGIGINSPSEKLQVMTAGSAYGIVHTNGNASIGTFVGGSSIYGGWLGTKSDHPLILFTNNGGPQLTIRQNGNVGIGTINPSYPLHVNGVAAASAFFTFSDARLKNNILPVRDGLSKILQLNGVSYTWNASLSPQFQFDSTPQLGFLAQEVEKILPQIVTTGADGYKAVNYTAIIPLLVESIKEQQHRIDEQQKINESLKARLEKVEKMLAK